MRPSSTSTSPGTSSPRTSAASTPSFTSPLLSAPSRPTPRAASARRRRRRRRAGTPVRPAHRRLPHSSASSTCSSDAPLASTTLRRARSRSFALAGVTPTIRPPYVRPSRIIVTVEIVLRTSFCAVPAFSRVEPAITSGPTTTAISCSARAAAWLSRALATATPSAPASRATSSAASTNGVEPLALTATTQSSGRRGSPRNAFVAAARSSSSASSWATTARTSPGGEPKVEPHSAASSAARAPDVPAPA